MVFSEKGYLNRRGEQIDFFRKRFQFWLENIPPDIRRLEHDLLKNQRELLHANLHRFDNRKKVGRFIVIPGFTEDVREASWGDFESSFLKGEERQERFLEIVQTAKKDIPELLEKYSDIIPKNKIKLIALGGSSLYGPRKQGQRLSDVDLNFLIDEKTDKLNFQVLPDIHSSEIPYHLYGTGFGDEARGKRQLHWLLYPHIPLENNTNDEQLKKIIGDLLESTELRKDKIVEYMNDLERRIKNKSEPQILG